MSKTLNLSAEKRTALGKQNNALRRNGMIPGNIFSRGHESLAVQIDCLKMVKIYSDAGHTNPIELTVDGNSHLVLIKEVDFDPVKRTLRHVGFQEVKKGEKVKAEVPVHLVGDQSPAEIQGMLIVLVTDSVEVEAEATHIPDHFEADKSKMEAADDVILVRDLAIPSGVTILTEGDRPIASVTVPRAEVEAEAAEAATEEATPATEETKVEE